MMAVHPEKLDHGVGKASTYAFAFLAGWLACGAYYGTLKLTHIQKVELPAAVQAAKCEDVRADRASVVAGQAIVANAVEGVRAPTPKEIPRDNCPPSQYVPD